MNDVTQGRSICVFCGSRSGERDDYENNALALGKALAEQQITLVYGGGGTGLMGAVANGVLAAGGRAVGVIPETLMERELAHTELDELHVVTDMHARKALMANLSGAFIAMPGGIGTMEELFEALTWQQLGIQSKPVGLLNVAGYYESLIQFLDTSVKQGFLDRATRDGLIISDDGARLVSDLAGQIDNASSANPS